LSTSPPFLSVRGEKVLLDPSLKAIEMFVDWELQRKVTVPLESFALVVKTL